MVDTILVAFVGLRPRRGGLPVTCLTILTLRLPACTRLLKERRKKSISKKTIVPHMIEDFFCWRQNHVSEEISRVFVVSVDTTWFLN